MATSQLDYVGAGGAVVHLDGTLRYVGTGLGVRGRAWSYDLTRRDITKVSRDAREATLTVDYLTPEAAEEARRVMDSDVAAGTPGTLVSGEWSQRAYVVAQEPTDRFHAWMRADMTVLLLDGVWRRLVTRSFGRGEARADYGKAYTYGYPYDYGPPRGGRTMVVDAPGACPFRLVVYGPAQSPRITIGGNVYEYDIGIPLGGYLLVDSRPDPTVTIHYADGRDVDAFASAHRGAGLGSGEYAFEPLTPGTKTVNWDGSFGFDLGVYLEEGEIPWT